MSEFQSSHIKYLMSLDPVHIGTGGTRLGRVDNSIVREPGTRLPKIPGTSLHGAIRSYAAFRFGSTDCAGQTNHCGDPCCPICQTFGYANGVAESQSRAGLVSISDAQLLLFPVYSLAGPVWVTSPAALRNAGAKENFSVGNEEVGLPAKLNRHKHLNLGWLMLPKASDDFSWPDELSAIPAEIKNRAVLVSDALFSIIVNSNLEVRTSVSIDPDTGAAQDKALFTYEAIPRTAIFWMNVVVEEHRQNEFPGKSWCESKNDDEKDQSTLEKYKNAGVAWESPIDVVDAGLEWMEHLGVGGMSTRGFGRVKVLSSQTNKQEAQNDMD